MIVDISHIWSQQLPKYHILKIVISSILAAGTILNFRIKEQYIRPHDTEHTSPPFHTITTISTHDVAADGKFFVKYRVWLIGFFLFQNLNPQYNKHILQLVSASHQGPLMSLRAEV